MTNPKYRLWKKVNGEWVLVGYEEWWPANDKAHLSDGWWYSRDNDNWHTDNRHDTYIPHDHKDAYTGLKDKNGAEIYEGDTLKISTDSEEEGLQEENTEVWFHKGKFLTRHYAFPVSSWAENDANQNVWCEVVGNIHENSSLLEVSK